MFFVVLSGTREFCEQGERAAGLHASALGLRCSREADRRNGAWEARALRLGRADAWPGCTTVRLGEDVWEIHGAGGRAFAEEVQDPYCPGSEETNRPRVRVDFKQRQFEVHMPMACVSQVLYVRTDVGWAVTDDARIFLRWFGVDLDSAAVAGLFAYSAIPAPLAICRRLRRAPNGFVTQASWTPERSEQHTIPWRPCRARQRRVGWPQAGEMVRSRLDGLVRNVPDGSVLCFSGGVDSGLLAARLAANGRRDIHLINCSFGEGDAEAAHARRMAAHLGMRLEQYTFCTADAADLLTAIPNEYSYPFGDYSTIPTNLMVRHFATRQAPGNVVIEGTGADGIFGRILPRLREWRWIYRMPRFASRVASAIYQRGRLWRYSSRRSYTAFVVSCLHRRRFLPFPYGALLANNALIQVCYPVDGEDLARLRSALGTSIAPLAADLELPDQMNMMDIVHICANLFAAKTWDPYRRRGIHAYYPFLEPVLLREGFEMSREDRLLDGEPKGVLKRLLCEHVPPDMVYRPKSGFTPPIEQILSADPFISYLGDAVLSDVNPLLPFIHRPTLRRIFDYLRAGTQLSLDVYVFLWTLIFTTAWLGGLGGPAVSKTMPTAHAVA